MTDVAGEPSRRSCMTTRQKKLRDLRIQSDASTWGQTVKWVWLFAPADGGSPPLSNKISDEMCWFVDLCVRVGNFSNL